MTKFDPSSRGFPLQTSFSRIALEKLLAELDNVEPDLARHLREQLLGGGPPELTRDSFEELLQLSQTNGIYNPAEEIARAIGELLFGRPLA
jgi:hypothetical protein